LFNTEYCLEHLTIVNSSRDSFCRLDCIFNPADVPCMLVRGAQTAEHTCSLRPCPRPGPSLPCQPLALGLPLSPRSRSLRTPPGRHAISGIFSLGFLALAIHNTFPLSPACTLKHLGFVHELFIFLVILEVLQTDETMMTENNEYSPEAHVTDVSVRQ